MRALNFFILALVILTMGCVKEDHFGPSSEKKILNFTLEGQVGNSQINQELNQITLTIAANADITDLVPSLVTISTFASLSPTIDISRDFSSPLQYIVEAENGSTVAYTIIVTQEGSEPQLENSSFDAWYTTPKGYYEPGADASSIWASGNAGVTTLGTANVNPLLISGIAFNRDCSIPALRVIILIEHELQAPNNSRRTTISSVTSTRDTLPLSAKR